MELLSAISATPPASTAQDTRGQWSRWTGGVQAGIDERSEALHALPVTEVSWNDVDAALRKGGLQLPTEAQWEYACRAGTSTPWWTGADAMGVSRGGVVDDAPCASVGSKAANAFGVHDTSGNVMEWCRDGYGQYASAASVDPFLANGSGRVFRVHLQSEAEFRREFESLVDSEPPPLTLERKGEPQA